MTHQVSNLPQVFVVITVDGRERLAFPNEGLSELFPSETSHLTLDGKGVYGFLPLDPPAREFFGLPESIPLGAGVAATYRFAGEKLLARGSEVFIGVVALSPDDMVLTVKGGGAMRHRSPGGVAWKREGSGGDWRLADVDPAAGVAVAIDGQGALLGIDLEKGDVRWQSPAETGLRVRRRPPAARWPGARVCQGAREAGHGVRPLLGHLERDRGRAGVCAPGDAGRAGGLARPRGVACGILANRDRERCGMADPG